MSNRADIIRNWDSHWGKNKFMASSSVVSGLL